MSKSCQVCGRRCYGELCFMHKPQKPIKRISRHKPGKHTNKDKYHNKKFRDSKLNHEGYLVCECCGSWNGSDADHTKSKGANPEVRYDDNFKQILCRFPCHYNKTNNIKCSHFVQDNGI